MSTERRYTSDEIQEGISAALKAKDFPAVVGLMQMLAPVDPVAAKMLYDAIVNRTVTVEFPL